MKNNQKSDPSTTLGAAICVLCCSLLLGSVASDCSRYKEETVAAAITYTEPENPEAQGFWDLFSDSLVGLFGISD